MENKITKLLIKELITSKYKLEKLIPSNNKSIICGIVLENNLHYFIKAFILKEVFKNEFLKFRLNKELKICEQIKNNSIYLQKFYKFFYTKHFAILVYEYFPKGNVEIKYKKVKFTKNELLIIIKDIFLGLEELKKLNIYHKYLSLEFIFLNKNNFKIGGYEYCDFIKSLKFSEIYHYKFIKSIHNINTLSPELIFNKFTGNKTAYFSWGIIIYFLIYKNFPIEDCTFEYLKIIYLNNLFKIDYNLIPFEWRYLISSCLQIYYNIRISSYSLKEELNYLFKNITNEKINKIRRKLFYEKTYSIKNLPKINEKNSINNTQKNSRQNSFVKNNLNMNIFLTSRRLITKEKNQKKSSKFVLKKNFKIEFKKHYLLNYKFKTIKK